jgi:hypothetical protein
MMQVIGINGSPRKQWNTATLVAKALEGAAAQGGILGTPYLIQKAANRPPTLFPNHIFADLPNIIPATTHIPPSIAVDFAKNRKILSVT